LLSRGALRIVRREYRGQRLGATGQVALEFAWLPESCCFPKGIVALFLLET
jgi:hypothetical protein